MLSSDRPKISSSATQRTGHTSGEEEHRIALIGEALNIHKERVERGAVRLGKDVVTEKQTVQVPVSREEVVINRRSPSGERR